MRVIRERNPHPNMPNVIMGCHRRQYDLEFFCFSGAYW